MAAMLGGADIASMSKRAPGVTVGAAGVTVANVSADTLIRATFTFAARPARYMTD
jgi:hypothetical protein